MANDGSCQVEAWRHGAEAREAPVFDMRPTRCSHVRTGFTCAIDPAQASAGKPWSTGISGSASSAFRSRSRCGTNTTPENREGRYGCPECCCYERRSAQRHPHCSRNHRAPRQVSGNPTELHSASRVWRRTAAVASKKIARRCAARSEAFSLLANPCPYWVSDGGRNFLPQFRACFPAFSDRLCIGDQLSPRPKFSGRQTLNIHSNNHLGVSVYGKIILSIDS
jgi:hypothetical protein